MNWIIITVALNGTAMDLDKLHFKTIAECTQKAIELQHSNVVNLLNSNANKRCVRSKK